MTTGWKLPAAFALAISSAAAQEPAASDPLQAIQASLAPDAPVVRAGESLRVVLSARFTQRIAVQGTVLAGQHLRLLSDGKVIRELDEIDERVVQVAAGTTITRDFTLRLGELFEAATLPASGQELQLVWPGLPGATCRVLLVPDQSGLDVAKLDLTRTRVRLVTSHGDLVLGFRPDKAPRHVESFVTLAKNGFYNGTRFHRVIKGFMIQGGCPNTKRGADGTPGTGDPGYRLPAEFNDLKHARGVLSMARSRAVDSAGCQFFVMHGDAPQLDGQYTIFGQLVSGGEVLDAIADVLVRPSEHGEPSVPVEDVHLFAAIVEPVLE